VTATGKEASAMTMTTEPTTKTAFAVLDSRGEIVVLLEGRDAPAAATDWAGDGYQVVTVELD
jgi:hypothetical protein